MTEETRSRFGAIQSPPDPRDLILTESTLAAVSAEPLPDSYRVPRRPPITDQGWTPQCVAYSTAYEQNQQDYNDNGRFFNFNEPAFFNAIGGGPGGAVARYALDRLLNYGYPEQDDTPSARRHRCAAYFRVELSVGAIKRAIKNFAGVLMVGPWWDSWSSPQGTRAILPPPSGSQNGHEWWAIGWTSDGYCIGQQTWGKAWGNGGLFLIRWEYIIQAFWEAWKTLDVESVPLVTKARIREVGTNIRTRAVLADGATLQPSNHWGQARRAGIWRKKDGKIVVEPWDKGFKYARHAKGARHGMQPWPDEWTVMTIAGTNVCVARPLTRIIT